MTETNLAIERQIVLDFKAALQKVEKEVRLAKEETQLVQEAAEAEKKAFYQLGAEETEARLSEELPEVCRDYCSISWAYALDAAGVPVDSALRLPEKVFFPPEIREIPDGAPKASKQALVIPNASICLIRPRILLRSPSPRVWGQIPKPKWFLLLNQSRKGILLLRLSL